VAVALLGTGVNAADLGAEIDDGIRKIRAAGFNRTGESLEFAGNGGDHQVLGFETDFAVEAVDDPLCLGGCQSIHVFSILMFKQQNYAMVRPQVNA
jgi:hypothetical protein